MLEGEELSLNDDTKDHFVIFQTDSSQWPGDTFLLEKKHKVFQSILSGYENEIKPGKILQNVKDFIQLFCKTLTAIHIIPLCYCSVKESYKLIVLKWRPYKVR